MALAHGGFNIPGTHEVNAGPWEYQRQENAVFGVEGVAVLFGERTTRPIVVESLIHDTSGTQAEMETFLQALEARAGVVGDLVETVNMARTFANCEFIRWEQEPGMGPFPPSGNVTSWWTRGRLHFLQLAPN